LTIIVGGFLALALGAPPAAIAVMVAAKIHFDLFLQLRSHEMNFVVGG
jgi:Na+/glutamate symporter